MKTTMTMWGMLVAMTLVLVLSGPALAKDQYAFTTIDVPGATATYANGNSTRAVVGEFDDQDGNTHGFVLAKGDFTPFDAPDADGYTSINGINARGDLSGIYFADGRYYGYFWRNGEFTTLDPPGSINTVALFLNGHDQVVGYAVDGQTRSRRAFVWHKGDFTPIAAPDEGPGGTRAIGINDHGEIVGGYGDKDHHLHGLLVSRGVYTTLDVPGTEDGSTLAQGINDAGVIVGFYDTGDGTSHGFVLRHGEYTTVDVPDSFWTEIYSINDKGEIVGAFEDENGVHGFRGKPAH